MITPRLTSSGGRAARLGLAAAVAVLGAGCGRSLPRTSEVRGRVTLDGGPLEGAAILFQPMDGGVPARGSSTADGAFVLSTFQEGDGAVPGRYRVAVSKVEVTGVAATPDGLSGPGTPGGVKERSLIPKRYADPATSGLTAEVGGGPTEVTLGIESH